MARPLDPPQIPNSEFVRHLGSGGFADVYLYRQRMPQRDVAVKVLRPDSGARESAAFEAEVNLMAQVSHHPSIVSFYSASTSEDGRSYLVMEYCPPPHLGRRAKERIFPVSQVLDIGVRIAGAVETLHRRGILHRDIKPMNILFTQFGHPVLTDFGIAVSTDEGHLEEAGFSIPWAPPEQQNGAGPFGPALDVYSLAATLHTVLTGHSPFEMPGGDNREFALLNRVLNQKVPTTGRADVPAELERILAIAMSKDPARRYKSAQEFALALQQVQVGLHQPQTPFEVEETSAVVEYDDADDRTAAAPIVMIDPNRPVPTSPDTAPRGGWTTVDFATSATAASQTTQNRTSPGDEGEDRTIGLAADDDDVTVASAIQQVDPVAAPMPTPAPPAVRDPAPESVEVDEERNGWGAVVVGFVLALVLIGAIAFGVWTYLRGEGATQVPTQSTPAESPIDGLPNENPDTGVTGLKGAVTSEGVTFTWDPLEEGTTYLYRVEDPLLEQPVHQTKEPNATVAPIKGRTCLSVAVRHANGTSTDQVIECVETP